MIDLSNLMKNDPENGIRALFRQYGGLVYCIVRRVLAGYPDDDVEECVSDVFYYLYRHRRRLNLSDRALDQNRGTPGDRPSEEGRANTGPAGGCALGGGGA